MRLTTTDIRSLLGSPDVTLLDARAPAEYRGFEGKPGGSAISPAPSTSPSRRRPSPAAAGSCRATAARPAAQGERHPRSAIVCYDASGIASAKLAFVLSLLGHDDVAVYDGGWSEWGDRLDLPVDR